MMEHVNAELLSAHLDGELAGEDRAGVERHLVQCASCSAAQRRLRALVRSAAELPRDVAPPPEVWHAVRRRIAGRTGRRRSFTRVGALLAAGIVLAAAALTLRPGRNATQVSAPQEKSVLLASVERGYEPSIAELRRALELQRGTLSPATVKVLEHSVAAIDAAIGEARAALAADPANQVIAGILAAQYTQKIDLLRRATALRPAT